MQKLHLLSCFYILWWVKEPKAWDEEKMLNNVILKRKNRIIKKYTVKLYK